MISDSFPFAQVVPPTDSTRIWRLLASLAEGGGFAGYVGWTMSDRQHHPVRVERPELPPPPR